MKFFERPERTDNINSCEIKQSYSEVISTARAWIRNKSEQDQILILDYIIDILIEDICSSGAADVLKNTSSSPFTKCIPRFCTDENNNTIDICTREKTEVNLSEVKLYVCPWNKSRTVDNLIRLNKTAFVFDETNHMSDFYTDINLCHVYNGNHSIHIGGYLKKGSITSNLCHTELLYPHCTTDGLYWYNKHTGDKLCNVPDFRLAAVFAAAQIRYELKEERK